MPFSFNADALQRDLAAVAREDWTAHFVTQNYDGDWSAIALRAPLGETHPIRLIFSNPGTKDYVDTPLLARTPYFRAVLQHFDCPLLSVRLMRLTPGSSIKAHRDRDLNDEEGTVRLHIPIATNDRVRFTLAGTDVVMGAGECWYLRLSEMHSAANDGLSDRVHIVIDATANDWLTAQLQAAEKYSGEHTSHAV
ncbi:MAG: aspartyl/asparaginyl beta-hydroxylase domain-containing protein [Rhizomicrobium sp.]|nr:aspartyl/asparaginyl beta-hydroxylase domain-containing protein [Rhizomicrobium sp.]